MWTPQFSFIKETYSVAQGLILLSCLKWVTARVFPSPCIRSLLNPVIGHYTSTGLAGGQWADIWSIMLSHYPASSALAQSVESKCSQFARKMGAGNHLQFTLNEMDIIKTHLAIPQCICSKAYDWPVCLSVSSAEADRSNFHGKWLMRLVLPREHRWGPVHIFTTG